MALKIPKSSKSFIVKAAVPHVIERGAGKALRVTGFLGMLQMPLMIAGALGGWAAPVDEHNKPKAVNSFRKGLGTFLKWPVEQLSRPISSYVSTDALNSAAGTVGNALAGAGKLVGADARADNRLKNITKEYEWAKEHPGFKIKGMDKIPEMMTQRKTLLETLLKNPNDEKSAKALAQHDETLNKVIAEAKNAVSPEPKGFFDFKAKKARDQVDKAVGRYEIAMQEEESAKARASFFKDPKTATENYLKTVTGQDVLSGAIQAGFVAEQVYTNHVQIKADRIAVQQALFDTTGKNYTKSQMMMMGIKSLFGNYGDIPKALQPEMKNYAKNTLLRTVFLVGEVGVMPRANKLLRKTSMGSVMGAGTSVAIISQVAGMAKGFLIKESPLMQTYQKLHMMEHMKQPLDAASILDLVVAASPQLQKKGGHMSMNAQLIARYWEANNTSVSEMMKTAAKGEAALMEVSAIAHQELVVMPQQQYEAQQMAPQQQPAEGKWANMTRNGMRAERGGKFTEMVGAEAGNAMLHRA